MTQVLSSASVTVVASEAASLDADPLQRAACRLLRLLSGGYAVAPDGELLEIRARVASLGRLVIHIYSREHGPPHFHVVAPDIDATFAISNAEHLDGRIGGRERDLVQYWHARERSLLVQKWNDSRPSDCPVGPMR